MRTKKVYTTESMYRRATDLWRMGGVANLKKAFKLLTVASTSGHVKATARLGACYDYGIGTRRNQRRAFQAYREAAFAGDHNCQYNVGACYTKGIGVEPNDVAAHHWYSLAAKHGVTDAMFALGLNHYYGFGTPKNAKVGLRLIQKAANRRNRWARQWLESYHPTRRIRQGIT